MKSRGKEKNELGVPSGKCLRGECDYLLWVCLTVLRDLVHNFRGFKLISPLSQNK